MTKYTSFILLITCFVGLSSASAAHYEIDKDHTTVGFTIRHLVISKVKGTFDKFNGSFEFDPKNSASWNANTTIEAASINTAVTKRDEHLRSPDFFDVQKFPTISFTTGKVKSSNGKTAKVEGTLTMHGVTKPVVLDVEIGGTTKDPWGNSRAAFSAKTKINRKDFGLNWNKALETGGLLVGEEVEINIEVEGLEKVANKT